MERRGFLTGVAGGFMTGLAAGSVGWLAGGRLVGAAKSGIYAHPVTFISPAEAAGNAAAFLISAAKTATDQAATFPQSVASGDPNPNGAVIWTRVAPDAMMQGALGQAAPASVAWQIATTADFSTVILQGMAGILAQNDNTVSLPIANTALQPFTVYYYQFIYNGVASRTGRFKTLPAAGASLDQVKIGLTVCQDYSNGFYNAYTYLAQEQLDVVLFLGDYVYEYLDDGAGGPDGGSVRVVPPFPSGRNYPSSLADYRHLYQTYRADPDIQAAHENFAFISLWDDHEFFNDCHQDFHEDTNPPGKSATTPQPGLRRAATKAWTEYSLAAVPYQPEQGFENQITVYRKFAYGALLDLVVTDERLYRDGPPCGDVEIGERYLTTGCAARAASARTMLGATQKQWFLDQITGSAATWKLWANEVMLAQYTIGAPIRGAQVFFSLDQWDGYPAERTGILQAISNAKVKNFVALSGDAHLFMTSYLKTNFDNLLERAMGVELMVGPISSGNYYDAGVDHPGAGRAPASSPAPARQLATEDLPPDSLSGLVLLFNQHMQFWNGSAWGYGVLTVTPQNLVCDFKAVSTVKHPAATLEALVTYTVPEGKVQLLKS